MKDVFDLLALFLTSRFICFRCLKNFPLKATQDLTLTLTRAVKNAITCVY